MTYFAIRYPKNVGSKQKYLCNLEIDSSAKKILDAVNTFQDDNF